MLKECRLDLDERLCRFAARNGHLEVLKWLRASGCPWSNGSKGTCAAAARGGHLEILQWARENGCPWDEKTCEEAAKFVHGEVFDWARANGAPNRGTLEDYH
ncbi:ankyrin repeat domain-containing protein [bacterium]|jgi:hypothetical protein|nr:ankyrin repeat domain-containing protein [bacterium]